MADNLNTKNGLLISLLVCLVLCGVFFGLCMWIWAPKTMPVKDVLFSRCSIIQTEQTIDLAGYFNPSTRNALFPTCYRDFTYEIIENDLFITVN
jgi:hypothetical protein